MAHSASMSACFSAYTRPRGVSATLLALLPLYVVEGAGCADIRQWHTLSVWRACGPIVHVIAAANGKLADDQRVELSINASELAGHVQNACLTIAVLWKEHEGWCH